ncbi:MAG: hypothetical protein AAFP78_13280, partial [Pseudomonadota bacterium]
APEDAEAAEETAEEDDEPVAATADAAEDAPRADKEETPADNEAAPAAIAPARPRIVVDKAKMSASKRAKVSVNTTVIKSDGSEEDATAEKPAAERKRRRVKVQKIVRPVEEEENENFLFSGEELHEDETAETELPPLELGAQDEEPLSLTMAEQVETEQVEAAPIAEIAEIAEGSSPEADDASPKRKRGGLNLGIFNRFSNREEETETAQGGDDAGFDRLRETAEADLPKLEEATRSLSQDAPERALFAVSGGAELGDGNSPAVFARQMGAQSLQDLLEASAAYVSIVEGKAHFSRRDVMQALNDIGIEKDYTPEARLKTFRKLVTAGAIIRSDDGMFAISHATRFGYETQLRARG